MRILSIICVLGFVSYAPIVHAQSTPRDVIVEKLALDGESNSKAAESEKDKSVPEPDILPETIKDKPDAIAPKANPARKPKPKQKPASHPDGLSPFYLTASEYRNTRGDSGPAMVLTYNVATAPLDDPETENVKSVTLTLGSDYAAFATGKSSRLYDFKLKRLLNVSTQAGENDGALYFDNLSLYAKAYRNLMTAKNASNNGKRDSVLLSAKSSIDTFWIDSAMGFAVRDVGKLLAVETDADTIQASYKNDLIADIAMSDAAYISEAHKNAFFAFAHHDIALHPLILLPLYNFDTVPETMKITIYNPGAPEGIVQTWTLRETAEQDIDFPLPAQAKSVTEREPISPLAFVINQAARRQALGGPPSAQELAREYDKAFLGGQYLVAWVLANRHQNQFGACKKTARQAICGAESAIRDLIKSGLLDSDRDQDKALVDYVGILDGINTPGKTQDAFSTYRQYMEKKSVPAFVERAIALSRAKLKKAAVKAAGIDDLDPEAILQSALAKDPYDPHTYLGLAQVLAANGKYEQSWDIYDAMRSGIPGGDSLAHKINRFEDNLETTAPAFFPPEP